MHTERAGQVSRHAVNRDNEIQRSYHLRCCMRVAHRIQNWFESFMPFVAGGILLQDIERDSRYLSQFFLSSEMECCGADPNCRLAR